MTKKKQEIPPPPDDTASDEELAAYVAKYSVEELEASGYVSELSAEEKEEIDNLAARVKSRVEAKRNARTQLNLAMSAEQLDRFIRYADRKHIPPSTLAKAWILERLDQEAKEF